MKLTPARLAEIRNSTPPRGHIDCGDRATAIWDLLEHVEAIERGEHAEYCGSHVLCDGRRMQCTCGASAKADKGGGK